MERQWRAASCAKEPWTVNWLRDAVGPGDVLYDIGANVGAFSLVAAKHCGAHVVAFNTRTRTLVGGFSLSANGAFVIAGLEPGPPD